MNIHLTDTYIKNIPTPSAKTFVWDADISQFGVRVMPTGSKTFILNYRINRSQKQIKIGAFPVWSVLKAREKAKELQRSVDAGNDPQGDKQARLNAPTMAQLWDYYEQHLMPQLSKKTIADRKSMLKVWLRPRFHSQKVAEVTFADVQAFHSEVSKAHPHQANRLLEFMNVVFQVAARLHWIANVPTHGVRANQEHPKQQFLSPDQCAAIGRILDLDGDKQSALIVRLLLLTGARKGELLGAEWDEFDLAAGVWVKPHDKTKQKREHIVHLSPQAVELLKVQEARRVGPYVFPGTDPAKPQGDIRKYIATLFERAKVPPVRIHDLRHTFASMAISKGVDLYTVSKLLGHKTIAATQRYANIHDRNLKKASAVVGKAIGGRRAVSA